MQIQATGGQGPKVLIIDDDPFIRIALCGILRKMNCRTLVADEGAKGVALFKSERPDVVITDLLMPYKEGFETITEIRAIDPQVRIVAMSGGGTVRNMEFLDKALSMGATRTLPKPFTPGHVREALTAAAKVVVH
jgi:DNA-binding response OmpR family regulator